MKKWRSLYHLIRADFLERVRRYSFLILMGAMVFLGYAVARGQISIWLGNTHRGIFNSAWIGLITTMATLPFVTLIGFYFVKNTLERDRRTGVGQILGSTPISRFIYILGKTLSNITVFVGILVILIPVAVSAQLWRGEDIRVELLPFLSPFLLFWLPTVIFISALAVFFETIPSLSGGFGNAIAFFLISMLLFYFPIEHNLLYADLAGYLLIRSIFASSFSNIIPNFDGHFQITLTNRQTLTPVLWEGIPWTTEIVLARVYWLGVGFVLIMLATVIFTYFDSFEGVEEKYHLTLGKRLWRRINQRLHTIKRRFQTLTKLDHRDLSIESQGIQLEALSPVQRCFNVFHALRSTLVLLLKGHRWWWYVVGAWLIIEGLRFPPDVARRDVLPLAWIWPLLIWSKMGVLEERYRTKELVFSTARPLIRQLPLTWLGGTLVTMLIGSGVLIRMVLESDYRGMVHWFVGAMFISSLALALGTWSNTSKLFEVIYTILWYVGPVEGIEVLDFMGASENVIRCHVESTQPQYSTNIPQIYLIATILLLGLAVVGRHKQFQI